MKIFHFNFILENARNLMLHRWFVRNKSDYHWKKYFKAKVNYGRLIREHKEGRVFEKSA